MKQCYHVSSALAPISVIRWYIFLQQISIKSWLRAPSHRQVTATFQAKTVYCGILEKLKSSPVVLLLWLRRQSPELLFCKFSPSLRALNALILLGPDEWYPGADTIWLLPMKDSLKFPCCEHTSTRTILSDLIPLRTAGCQPPNPHCHAWPLHQSYRKQT